MKKILSNAVILLFIIAFGIFIYPGIYEYDKSEQRYPVKINRLTGSAQILRGDGWHKIDSPKESEMQSLRIELQTKLDQQKKELLEVLNADRENVKNDITNSIESKIITQVQNDLKAVNEEITAYKKFETDPANYFSIGSTKEEVKKIMGPPTGTNDFFDYWYYGLSRITFKNGKVSEYSNDGNLRIK